MSDRSPLRAPSDFERRILIATLGKSPAVLTETIFHLVVAQTPAFIPTEIHIITTLEGAHRARLSLLDPSMAKLTVLSKDYDLPDLSNALSPENIHVIADETGRNLPDIATGGDSAATANLITSLVRELTADPASALHVSIAGGRKTMGFLLGYAITLFGRMQDRLSHVLVDEPFDTLHDFFFPPRQPIVMRDHSGRPVSTADAGVRLADIPFVRLRHGMPTRLLEGHETYSETVDLMQEVLAAPKMIIDHDTCTLTCNNKPVRLPPLTFAFAAWLARRAVTMGTDQAAISTRAYDHSCLAAIAAEYSIIPAKLLSKPDMPKALVVGRDGADSSVLTEQLTRIRSALRSTLGTSAEPFLPKEFSKSKEGKRLGFGIDSNQIGFNARADV